MLRRSIGSPALFAIVYSSVASSLYFSLGAVAKHALAATPIVFFVAAIYFVLCVLTYVEGASLHQERAGSTVFARYAFNELWSFVAGWALILDYVILIAITAFTATNYLGAFWGRLSHGWVEIAVAIAVIAFVVVTNIRGLSPGRVRRLFAMVVSDLVLQVVLIALGFALVFDGDKLTNEIHFGTAPTWSNAIFALTLAAVVAATGLETSSGLAGEVAIGRRGLKRLVTSRVLTVFVIYVGVSLVALSAVPVTHGQTALGGRFMDAPLLGVVGAYHPGSSLADILRHVVGAMGAIVLIAACNSAMLGVSRVGYSLATNRQIPSAVGRLHATRATPFVVIGIAAALAAGLVVPGDLGLLIGLYAYGAMIAFTIAHLAVCVLRYREPQRDRPYRMPGSLRIRGGELPLPAVAGAILSAVGWVSIVVNHTGARAVGSVWMIAGLALYVIYRTTEDKPVLRRVVVPEEALRRDPSEARYGSILVPLLGTPLDDDIVQTAGRLAREDRDDEEGGAVIEALWVFEIPLALPVDAPLPERQLQEARRALARAKAVGEEYAGVEVATATVRARRAGQAIVDEARRRGVEVIVLAAEEPSRIRGGALLGGRGGPLDNFIGEATRYVVNKAPCRVVLTAPAADADDGRPAATDGAKAEGEAVTAAAEGSAGESHEGRAHVDESQPPERGEPTQAPR